MTDETPFDPAVFDSDIFDATTNTSGRSLDVVYVSMPDQPTVEVS